MPGLRELQRSFSAAMQGRVAGIVPAIDGGALGAAARLGIYRNAIAATRLRALRETFPTVEALVGAPFFERLAHRYADGAPPSSGNLCAYGGQFAEFIGEFREAIEPVPYLADVARLDWLRLEAALAADADVYTAPDPRQWRRAAAEHDRVGATLHPSLRLIRSAFPIFSIHRWCAAPSDPAPSLADGPECGLIWRVAGEVAQSAIHPASYTFVEALRRGSSLAEATAAAGSRDTGFDPIDCSRSMLDQRLIVAFTLPARSS